MLTKNQQKEYFSTQSGSATPLSPLEYEKSLLTPEKKEPIIVSQGLADDAIKKADETKARLTPDEYLEQGGALKDGQIPKKEEPTITPTGREINPITLLNEVGQEVTFDNPDVNIQNIQRYLDQGYEVKSGSLPSGVSVGGQADPLQDEINRSTQEIDEAKAVYDNAVNELRNLDVKNDPRFQSISKGITDTWNVRIREMETANTSRQAKLQQTGIRMGSRFVSMGTSFGGVITQEEREGISRVAELESKKQTALASAETAFRSEKWREYTEYIALAEDSYEREIAELEALNENAIAQSKLQREAVKEQRETEEFEMERVENVLENTIDSIFNAMTGDNETDLQTINDFALMYDIDPNYLISGLTAKQGEEEKRTADLEAVQALTKSREASATKSLRVSDTSPKINELDKAMSPNELRVIRDDYGLSTEDLPVGATMRDVQELQAKKFMEDNKDEDPEKVKTVVAENTNLEMSLIDKIAISVFEFFGGKKKTEPKEKENEMKDIDDILNSF